MPFYIGRKVAFGCYLSHMVGLFNGGEGHRLLTRPHQFKVFLPGSVTQNSRNYLQIGANTSEVWALFYQEKFEFCTNEINSEAF